MEMTDKERILLELVRELHSTMLLRCRLHKEDLVDDIGSSGYYTHFANYCRDGEIRPGMMVLCMTSGRFYPHGWTVGFVERVYSSNDMMIREIGTDRLCRIGNERFVPIVGMKDYQLYEKEEYLFSVKVNKAFRRADDYLHYFDGLEFLPDNEVLISVREKWGGPRHKSKPYTIRMKWCKSMTIKKILEIMQEQGYGTRDFELVEEENEAKEGITAPSS